MFNLIYYYFTYNYFIRNFEELTTNELMNKFEKQETDITK